MHYIYYIYVYINIYIFLYIFRTLSSWHTRPAFGLSRGLALKSRINKPSDAVFYLTRFHSAKPGQNPDPQTRVGWPPRLFCPFSVVNQGFPGFDPQSYLNQWFFWPDVVQNATHAWLWQWNLPQFSISHLLVRTLQGSLQSECVICMLEIGPEARWLGTPWNTTRGDETWEAKPGESVETSRYKGHWQTLEAKRVYKYTYDWLILDCN